MQSSGRSRSPVSPAALIVSIIAIVGAVTFHGPVVRYLLEGSTFRQLLSGGGVARGPFVRSIGLAFVASLLSVSIGFWFAVLIVPVRLASRLSWVLLLLLLPLTIGDLSIAALIRSIYAATPAALQLFASRSPYVVWPAAAAIESWKYVPLCSYLFWLRLVLLPRNVTYFVRSGGLTQGEAVSDVLWPSAQSLAALLMLICFVFVSQEHTVLDLVLKSSPGTSTELAGNLLEREYYQNLNAFALPVASAATLQNGSAYLILVLVTAILSVALGLRCMSVQVTVCRKLLRGRSPLWLARALCSVACLAIVSIPAYGLIILRPIPFDSGGAITNALFLSVVAGVVATGAAVLIASTWRCAFRELTAAISGRSMFLLHGLFALPSVPSLCVLLSAFAWLSLFATAGATMWYAAWFVGQIVLVLPLLIAFLIWTHTAVKPAEIELHDAAGASLNEVLKISFVSRFRVEYALTALFAASLVWNEPSLSRTLSDVVPSFAAMLSPRLVGRAVEYHQAGMLVLVSLAFALASLCLWSRIASSRWRGIES